MAARVSPLLYRQAILKEIKKIFSNDSVKHKTFTKMILGLRCVLFKEYLYQSVKESEFLLNICFLNALQCLKKIFSIRIDREGVVISYVSFFKPVIVARLPSVHFRIRSHIFAFVAYQLNVKPLKDSLNLRRPKFPVNLVCRTHSQPFYAYV